MRITKMKSVLAICAFAVLAVPGSGRSARHRDSRRGSGLGLRDAEFTVPHGCDGAATNSIAIKMPPQVVSATPRRYPAGNIRSRKASCRSRSTRTAKPSPKGSGKSPGPAARCPTASPAVRARRRFSGTEGEPPSSRSSRAAKAERDRMDPVDSRQRRGAGASGPDRDPRCCRGRRTEHGAEAEDVTRMGSTPNSAIPNRIPRRFGQRTGDRRTDRRRSRPLRRWNGTGHLPPFQAVEIVHEKSAGIPDRAPGPPALPGVAGAHIEVDPTKPRPARLPTSAS